MKIGILVPSIYMHDQAFQNRISAPMVLSLVMADGLIKKGIEVVFFSGPGVPTKAKVVSSDEDLINANYKVDYQQDLPKNTYETVSLYEKKKYFELGIVSKAYKMALNKEVDLLHVYHAYGNLAHYFAELLHVPTLFTLHVLPPPENSFERWRYKRFANQNFVAISNSQKKGFLDIIPDMNVVNTIYHGISQEDFGFSLTPQDYIAFVGRAIPEKGLDIGIKLAIEENVCIRIATHLNEVALDSDYYKKEIEPHIKNKYVELTDLFDLKEKARFYQNAKTFISPVRWEEPFGMVMIEAMSCGTPVIAFARGSVLEVVKDGETGFIVNSSPDDIRGDWIIKKTGIEGLREALNRIFSMPKDQYEQMRRNCRKRTEEKFTVDKMVDSYEALYKKILGI